VGVLPVGNKTERQVRPLLQLPAGERAAAWKEATREAGNGKVTASGKGPARRAVVDDRNPKPPGRSVFLHAGPRALYREDDRCKYQVPSPEFLEPLTMPFMALRFGLRKAA
jgi:hypothetical protein